jgi:hypothetical protein
MSANTCHNQIRDVYLTLTAPFEEIWFVQHMIESMDGLGLVTSSLKPEFPGSLQVLTTSDRLPELNALFLQLSQMIGNLEIVHVESP